nr:MAG TPA: hypothetical protein [Caudoviricetes sp.]
MKPTLLDYRRQRGGPSPTQTRKENKNGTR